MCVTIIMYIVKHWTRQHRLASFNHDYNHLSSDKHSSIIT